MQQTELFLLKLGEVVLKGLNRHFFEERLMNNVRRRLRQCGGRYHLELRQSTIYVEPMNED